MADKQLSDEQKLYKSLAGYNERSPLRYQALLELNRRAAEQAGATTLRWTRVAAWAAIVGAVAAIAGAILAAIPFLR